MDLPARAQRGIRACIGHPLFRQARQATDRRGAGIHQHHIVLAQRIGEQRLMAVVEARRNPVQQVVRLPVEAVQRDVHLEDLLAIAHVGRALDRDLAGMAGRKPLAGGAFQLVEHAAHCGGVEGRRVADMCPRGLEAQVRRQHAPSGKHGGHPRNHHPRDIQLARNIGDVDAGGPAEREQREAARVHAPPHGNQADALGHVGVHDAVNALGRRHSIHP